MRTSTSTKTKIRTKTRTKTKTLALLVTLALLLTSVLPLGIGSVKAGTDLTTTFRQGENGYSGVLDTRVKSTNPDTIYNTNVLLRMSRYRNSTTNLTNYPIIKFQNIQTSVPLGATVTSAYIDFYVADAQSTTYSDTVDFFQFNDSDIDFPTATWHSKAGGVTWANGTNNGPVADADYNSTPIAKQLVSASQKGQHIQVQIPSTLVQSWLDNPSTNTGIMLGLETDSATDQYIDFGSSDTPTVAQRPQLIINSTGGTVQTPGPTVAPTPTPVLPTGTPELPRVFIDSTYSLPTGGNTINVNAGDDLQKAINNALPGDVLVLQAGATFTGHYNLPNKGSDKWIYITSSAYSNLPAPEHRVSPSDAANMPKIVTADVSPAITVSEKANHYRFVGVEIATSFATHDANLNYNIIDLSIQSGLYTTSQLAHDITFDRCYIHGTPTGNVKRGITANSGALAVVDSYISDIHGVGFDNQAIGGFNGCGPFKIVNNYLEAACENVIFGGSDAINESFQPQDIEIRGNYMYKPMSWYANDPSYAGIHWSVKNLFELKNARRALIDGNVFENHWADGQSGPSILITVRDQDGSNPWATVQDVTFTNNTIKHVASGFNILGLDDNYPSVESTNVLIKNNVMEDVEGSALGGNGAIMLLQGITNNYVVDHNTFPSSKGSILAPSGPQGAHTNFKFTNNIALHNSYGILGSNRGIGNDSIDYYLPGSTVTKNIIVAMPANYKYPAGNIFVNSMNDVGFVNYNSGIDGDFHLASTSAYAKAGTDGKDIGADLDSLNSAQTYTLSGAGNMPYTADIIPTSSPAPTQSSQPTATPVQSSQPTATPTSRPTSTPVQSSQPTPTPTTKPTSSPSPTQSSQPTVTPVQSSQPTATPVQSSQPTATPVQSSQPTETPIPTPEVTFPDVSATSLSWAVNEIQTLATEGIIKGTTDGNGNVVYDPYAQVTRAQLTKLIVEAFKIDGSGADATFSDVPSTAWYYDYVGKAYKNKIINGTSADTFGPDSPITRQDMACIIIRAMVKYKQISLADDESNLSIFADKDSIADYAKINVATAVNLGIIKGSNQGNNVIFAPKDNTNRAQAAVVVYRMLYNEQG